MVTGAIGWRAGSKVPINVYEGERPVCQCHTAADAARIVKAMNREESAAESVEMLQLMLDQIDGDPRAVQFFDLRLIERTKAVIAKACG